VGISHVKQSHTSQLCATFSPPVYCRSRIPIPGSHNLECCVQQKIIHRVVYLYTGPRILDEELHLYVTVSMYFIESEISILIDSSEMTGWAPTLVIDCHSLDETHPSRTALSAWHWASAAPRTRDYNIGIIDTICIIDCLPFHQSQSDTTQFTMSHLFLESNSQLWAAISPDHCTYVA